MVEKESVDIATGQVSRERWYLLTSLSPRQCGTRELLRVFCNHWSVENSLHHVKDRSWDEDVHTLRLEGWFPARMTLPLRAKTCALRPAQPIARLYGRASCLCNRPASSPG